MHVGKAVPAGYTAAHLPCCGDLFRCSQVGFRESAPLSRARNLALVPFQYSLVHLRPFASLRTCSTPLPHFDVEGNQFATIQPFAVTCRQAFAFLRLLLGGIGDDDAVARGFLLLDPLYHKAVV